MSIDAAGMKYFTGRGGVVTPNDPLPTIEAVARAYQPTWLVLERDDIARELAPVLPRRRPTRMDRAAGLRGPGRGRRHPAPAPLPGLRDAGRRPLRRPGMTA